MNRKSRLPALFLLVCITALAVNCSKEEIKAAKAFFGPFVGDAFDNANSTNKKALSINVTSTDNPVAGTYNLAGTPGNISGSILGNILNLTLKPTATGTTYTFSGTTNDDDTAITGTMTGVESGTAVKYNVNLKK